MGSGGEEDVEYESDPEESKGSLTMRRRREASDDEEEPEIKGSDRLVIHSDESNGEGGVADYDEEEELKEEEEEEEEEAEEEEVYGEEMGGEEGDVNGSVIIAKGSDDADAKLHLEEGEGEEGEDSGNKDGEEEKKENEPFAVPTAGAFYMHDDRFRDNAGGRNRRMRGGNRLWESKDDRKWGHDKFEEITLQNRHKEGRRSSRGNNRGGSGKSRGIGRGGYAQGSRKEYDNSGNQSQVPKAVVRGRGPRKYVPTFKRSDQTSQMQNKQSSKPFERTSHVSSGRTSAAPTSNFEYDPAPAKKQVVASNLNYASPPFYPSSASSKENNLTPKRDVQTGSTSRNVRPGIVNEGFSVQQNNAMLRGKNVVDTISMDKLYIDDSGSQSVGKPFNNLPVAPPRSSGVNASQSPHPRAPVRGGAMPVQMNYQPANSHNQVNKFAPMQNPAIQKNSAPGRISTNVQAPAPHLGHRPGSGSQASSQPKKSAAINSLGSGEIDAASEPSKSEGAMVGKGRGGSQGSGRGSFVYGGAMMSAGNMGGNHGDPNFPAFLPVMQFGGQHPGGIGVPTVGMAFPGYVGQGSSEMTWLPVLAGAAGALGASCIPPYLTVDGAYHPLQSGQTSAMATSSKENNASKANSELKPQQRPEPVSNEFGQRQNKSRRYSEMDFGQ